MAHTLEASASHACGKMADLAYNRYVDSFRASLGSVSDRIDPAVMEAILRAFKNVIDRLTSDIFNHAGDTEVEELRMRNPRAAHSKFLQFLKSSSHNKTQVRAQAKPSQSKTNKKNHILDDSDKCKIYEFYIENKRTMNLSRMHATLADRYPINLETFRNVVRAGNAGNLPMQESVSKTSSTVPLPSSTDPSSVPEIQKKSKRGRPISGRHYIHLSATDKMELYKYYCNHSVRMSIAKMYKEIYKNFKISLETFRRLIKEGRSGSLFGGKAQDSIRSNVDNLDQTASDHSDDDEEAKFLRELLANRKTRRNDAKSRNDANQEDEAVSSKKFHRRTPAERLKIYTIYRQYKNSLPPGALHRYLCKRFNSSKSTVLKVIRDGDGGSNFITPSRLFPNAKILLENENPPPPVELQLVEIPKRKSRKRVKGLNTHCPAAIKEVIYKYYLKTQHSLNFTQMHAEVQAKYGIGRETFRKIIIHGNDGSDFKRKEQKNLKRKFSVETLNEMLQYARDNITLTTREIATKYGVSLNYCKNLLQKNKIKRLDARDRRVIRLHGEGQEYEPWSKRIKSKDKKPDSALNQTSEQAQTIDEQLLQQEGVPGQIPVTLSIDTPTGQMTTLVHAASILNPIHATHPYQLHDHVTHTLLAHHHPLAHHHHQHQIHSESQHIQLLQPQNYSTHVAEQQQQHQEVVIEHVPTASATELIQVDPHHHHHGETLLDGTLFSATVTSDHHTFPAGSVFHVTSHHEPHQSTFMNPNP